jgi:4-hydroxy-3-polyprenylbenzoate decarboxylase
MTATHSVALAMTGASGAAYGLRLLECLVRAGRRVLFLISAPGQIVVNTETDLRLPSRPAEMQAFLTDRYGAAAGQIRVYGREQWMAPLASGSNPPGAMVICPCTTGTLAAVANGLSTSLIERAADVVLKERRPLIRVVRETPFSEIHLENMLRLVRVGATVLPANPGFYHRPAAVSDLVDYIVARVLDHLGIEHDLLPRWGVD